MRVFSKTDKGKVRSINQDAYVASILPDGTAVTIVCDGMGGANAGDIASKTAADIISKYVLNSYSPAMTTDQIARLISNAVSSANIEVYSISKKNIDLSGMGTTVVAAVVREKQAVICSIGDSRAYLINDNIVQITRDHSIVQSLVESGKISPEQARIHPEKNVITRAVGVENNVLVDSYFIDFNLNDKILLCTDGLSNFVSDNNILHIFKTFNTENIADVLVKSANQGGGGDNITAVVISH